MNGIGNFWRTHVVGKQPARDFAPNLGLGLAAGVTALGTGVGAAIGASRAAHDVVTVERIPYRETEQVQIGTHPETGCSQYHFGYNWQSGGFDYHYGWDSSCKYDAPTYETRETGRTLERVVTHHTESFPHSLLQGALLGAGLGVAASVLGAVLHSSLQER